MELNGRKKDILGAIIKVYMETGEPVGSKLLSNILGNTLSSATLRNEMSELSEMGYLEQPHTSAGRAPTNTGFRFYITTLMPAQTPRSAIARRLDEHLNTLPDDPNRLFPAACAALSALTGLPAFCGRLEDEDALIEGVCVSHIGAGRFTVSMLSSHACIKSRLCKLSSDIDEESLVQLNVTVMNKINGKRLSDFAHGDKQALLLQFPDIKLCLSPLLLVIFELAQELLSGQLYVSGTANIYKFPEFRENAGKLTELMNEKDALLSLLEKQNARTHIIFGEDSGIRALAPTGTITSAFALGGALSGRIGVVGPKRMNYAMLVPCIEAFAKKLEGKILKVIERNDGVGKEE